MLTRVESDSRRIIGLAQAGRGFGNGESTGRAKSEGAAGNREALEGSGSAAQADLDSAVARTNQAARRRAQFASTQAQLANAQAQLKEAEVRLGYTKIYAPLQGQYWCAPRAKAKF